MRIIGIAAVAAALTLGMATDGVAQNQQIASTDPVGAWRPLSGPELQSVLISRKIGTLNRYNEPFLQMFTADGRVYSQVHPADQGPTQGRVNPHAIMTDTGTHQIRGNQVCISMQGFLQGKEVCWSLETNGTYYRFSEAGPLTGKYAYFDSVPWPGGNWVWQYAGGGSR